MSRFRLFRHLLASSGGVTSVTYDTSIGNGVDINGFASLPLYAPGTDGADLATATPTLDSGSVTYNSGTRTLTDTGSAPIARWTGILTPGQSYHIVMNLTVSSFARLIIVDESATTQWSSPYVGNGSSKTFLVDALFTATGHDLIFQRTDDVFTGSIQMVKVAQNTGGVGGRRFYVRPSTGSATNNGIQAQSPSTPLTTVAQALRFVQSGRGDQILIAQGESLTNGLANFAGVGGFSAAYPLVVQSYDPSDATNEAKLGRAAGSNRPVISASGADMTLGLIGGSVASAPYVAFRGLKFDAAAAGNVENTVTLSSFGGSLDYLLFENNEFSAAQLSVQGHNSGAMISHIVVRNCSFHGQYDSANRGDAQGFYASFTNYVMLEDNCFANCGWKEGASYTASYSLGGASIYGHPFYLQDDTRLGTARRNVFIRNANDGGKPKGDCNYYHNLVINSDIGFSGGGGNFYSTAAPSGVDLQVSYNVFIGGNQQATNSWGMWIVNGATTSSAHHNVIAQAGQASYAFLLDAQVDDGGGALPCYMNAYSNVVDAWAYNDGAVIFNGHSGTSDLSLIHLTTNNNYWDDAASGTNQNISALTRPTRYTVSSLITALGYADLATAQAAWLSDPASHGWRTGTKLALVGYGVDISAMPFLA